jgi:4-alpha-glucanotransferase
VALYIVPVVPASEMQPVRVPAPAVMDVRSAGVLLHVTSLPGGRLGETARRFVDWLAAAGQRWWQVLPVGPPDRVGSPYATLSAFAGSPGLLGDPGAPVSREEAAAFTEREASWLPAWTAFAGEGALDDQVRFQREWADLRRYASERGVGLIGDMPLYVAPDGADHRSRPELFRRGVVAGAPPDAYSADGQLWRNPFYDWPAMRREGYAWWVERLRRTFELFDLVRIDHFRGLVSGWAVPEDAPTAAFGRWLPGPGGGPILAARARLGELPMFAEDLGVVTPAVERLRDELGLPGLRVLQFGFSGRRRDPHAIANLTEHTVVYPGTHDGDTAVGWWSGAPEEVRRRARRAFAAVGAADEPPHRAMTRLALSSRPRLAIVPMQDLLGLGSEARMNTPGTETGNWSWRMEEGALTAGLADWLREATREGARLYGD